MKSVAIISLSMPSADIAFCLKYFALYYLSSVRFCTFMQDFITYLDKTESAVKNIFDGIEYYKKILAPIKGAIYVGGGANKQEAEKNFNQWAEKNQDALNASIEAQKKFFEESFAMATLCGAVLQIAAKAIECFSALDHVPENLLPIIGDSKAIRKFCIGREVKGLPIGLIIYAGRNQHTHYNDAKLSAANTAIFSKLAEVPGHPDIADPALDLRRPNILSLADNITFILGWRTYRDYRMDMESLLNTKPD
ncbi:hypothetical protein ACJ67_01295 [Methylophilus sp. TWE2]|nr:hypothetical protein ACJ67_01295 [Methylophilus sp. TWE2]